MSAENGLDSVATVPSGVGDAVGVERAKWFVAIVGNNTEKSSAEKLEKLGYTCYVASQQELRIWKNGRRKKVDKVIVTSTVFIMCTEKERRQIVNLPFIYRFMTNRAGESANGLHKPLATIPQYQMNALQFMLGHSDSPVYISGQYHRGEKVRVIRGSLRGLEGEIVSLADGTSELVVVLDVLGCAKVHINPIDVERV